MNKTKIEWVKNPDGSQGYTWNPITGCLNGCSYCYARKLANGRLKQRYLANSGYAPNDKCDASYLKGRYDPFYPRFWPEKLDNFGNPYNRGHKVKPKGVFVCNMSDLFGIGVPEEWTRKVLSAIQETPHRAYLLTKQPQNLAKFSPFPPNCWVGVSVTDAGMLRTAHEALLGVDARIKFLSFEPLLDWNWQDDTQETPMSPPGTLMDYFDDLIDWLIIGAQTKPYNPPKIEWVKTIVEAADSAGVPVFLKNNLLPLIAKLTIKDKWVWAKDLGHGGLIRQEIPGR